MGNDFGNYCSTKQTHIFLIQRYFLQLNLFSEFGISWQQLQLQFSPLAPIITNAFVDEEFRKLLRLHYEKRCYVNILGLKGKCAILYQEVITASGEKHIFQFLQIKYIAKQLANKYESVRAYTK